MAKFVILYRAAASAREQMANASPEEAKAGMDAWMTWAGKAGSAIVDLGAPLAHATHVGPGDAGADDVAGYSILQADSLQAVEAVLDGHPHLFMPGGSIEILELLSIPGM
jgi:hypothetical protein